MSNQTRTRLENLRLARLEPQDLIAPNFRFYELTRSELASRMGVDNAFSDDLTMRAAVNLARSCSPCAIISVVSRPTASKQDDS